MTTSTVPAAEVYATWGNYAGSVVVEYVDGTRTVDGVTAPVCDAPTWPASSAAVFDAWRADGVARSIPLWAVIETAGVSDSEGFVSTCGGCRDMWPSERLDFECFMCPLCLAAEAAERYR